MAKKKDKFVTKIEDEDEDNDFRLCDGCDAVISKEEYDANGGYCNGCVILNGGVTSI